MPNVRTSTSGVVALYPAFSFITFSVGGGGCETGTEVFAGWRFVTINGSHRDGTIHAKHRRVEGLASSMWWITCNMDRTLHRMYHILMRFRIICMLFIVAGACAHDYMNMYSFMLVHACVGLCVYVFSFGPFAGQGESGHQRQQNISGIYVYMHECGYGYGERATACACVFLCE